jgi:glutathione synthase/RimK-type ligase-like ATP-grasp enzyme
VVNRPLVVLATAVGEVDFDDDLDAMVQRLRSMGLNCQAVAWDEPDFDWSTTTLVVNRSTWDYCGRLEEYLAWTRRVSAVTALSNPAQVIAWNTDKRYLNDLVAAGVTAVPSRFSAPGEATTFPESGDFVVKPAVSSGAKDTARYGQEQRAAAEEHVRMLHASGQVAMVQPYLTRISEGEGALVFLGGAFSHAIRKGPLLTESGVIDNNRVAHPNLVDYTPSDAELAIAAQALSACLNSDDLLYARVDLAVGEDGTPVVLELELTEPNLFCTRSEAAMANFANAVQEKIVTVT